MRHVKSLPGKDLSVCVNSCPSHYWRIFLDTEERKITCVQVSVLTVIVHLLMPDLIRSMF